MATFFLSAAAHPECRQQYTADIAVTSGIEGSLMHAITYHTKECGYASKIWQILNLCSCADHPAGCICPKITRSRVRQVSSRSRKSSEMYRFRAAAYVKKGLLRFPCGQLQGL